MATLVLGAEAAWMVKLPAARVTHRAACFCCGVSRRLLEVVAAGVVTVTLVLPASKVAVPTDLPCTCTGPLATRAGPLVLVARTPMPLVLVPQTPVPLVVLVPPTTP